MKPSVIALFGAGLLAAVANAAPPPVACHDDPVEKVTAYDKSHSGNAGGPIKQVEFKSDHTLLTIDGPEDQEICAILPPRAELIRRKVNLASLAPGKFAMVDGYMHRTDQHHLWARSIQSTSSGRGTELRPN
jgi:hypothetical protein